jgi:hypothetical protein
MPSVFPPGALLSARYRIVRPLAHGPLATLYEAEDLASRERATLKWLRLAGAAHTAVDVLVERARAAMRLTHVDLATVHEVVREEDGLFMVRERVQGEPYSHLLAGHLMPLDERVAVLLALARALSAAHAARVSHLGLHPDNLFVLQRGANGPRIKLLDFAANQTHAAAMLGSTDHVPAGHHVYMAPEQFARAGEIGPRTDVYAYAVLLYQALTCALPFAGETPAAVHAALSAGAEPPLACALRDDVPRPLAELLHACLARKLEQRPARLDSLIAPLEQFARSLAAQAGPITVPIAAHVEARTSEARRVREPRMVETLPMFPGQPLGAEQAHALAAAPPPVQPRRSRRDVMALGGASTVMLVCLLAWLGLAYATRRPAAPPPPLPEVAFMQASPVRAEPLVDASQREPASSGQHVQEAHVRAGSRAARHAPKKRKSSDAPARADVRGEARESTEDNFRAGRPLSHDDF